MQSSSKFQVTGDTTTLHAGSYGNFVIATNSSIQFYDLTYPGTTTKIHLSGIYQYNYDGNVLRLTGGNPAGTETYKYILRKN
jgi:hypothetical protein